MLSALLLPGGPPGCQDPVSSTRGSPLSRAPAADCRHTSRAYVPTAWHPPQTRASTFFLLVPGEPRPGCGHPASPAPAACTFLAEVSPANAGATPAVFSRLPPFLDTEVLNGTRPGHPLCARGSEETRQKEKYNTEPSRRCLGALPGPACSHPQNILRNNAFPLLGDSVPCLEKSSSWGQGRVNEAAEKM